MVGKDQTTAPDAVMASMETETDPLSDAVAAAWDTELDPPPDRPSLPSCIFNAFRRHRKW